MPTTDRPPMRISLKQRFADTDSYRRLVLAAEAAGLYGVWLNEPWGYDAAPLLGWAAGATTGLRLGTHVASVYSRTPAMFAGLAASMQVISDGRFRLGLGASGPQVVEGWHGRPFRQPVELTADVIAIVRKALRGERVEHQGRAVTLPLPDGPGKALRFHELPGPLEVPIYAAAMGERNVTRMAEIADGWSPYPWSPERAGGLADWMAAGTARRDPALAPLVLAPSVGLGFGAGDALRATERRHVAAQFGAMGTSGHNFYVNSAAALGFGDMARAVQTRWLTGDRRGALSLVADDYLDQTTLFGTAEAIRTGLDRYRAAGVGELIVELRARSLDEQLADVARLGELVDA
jgi:F420-dependent oxidoreductase-like protein